MHGDALTLILIGLAVLVLAVWRTRRKRSVIGSKIQLTPQREADFDQEWP
jgi:hypothetical protein